MMKKIAALLAIALLPFLVACGGDGGMAAALNPFGFVIASLNTVKNPTLTSSDVRSLVKPVAYGSMFVGTAAGLFSFDPSNLTPTFTRVDSGVALPAINKLVVDGVAGDFFICTDNGLKKYTASTKSIADVNVADFGGKRVLTIARQNDNVLWVGLDDATAVNTVAKINSGVVAFYGSAKGMVASSVAHIYADSSIVVACGTGSTGKMGLFKFNTTGDSFAQEAVNIGLEKGASLLFKIGTYWYAGGPDSGLTVSTNNRDTWAKTNLQACSPVAFASEATGTSVGTRYWIATDKGLYLSYNMVDFNLFSTTKGMAANLTSDVCAADVNIYSSHNTAAGGLSRLSFDGN